MTKSTSIEAARREGVTVQAIWMRALHEKRRALGQNTSTGRPLVNHIHPKLHGLGLSKAEYAKRWREETNYRSKAHHERG